MNLMSNLPHVQDLSDLEVQKINSRTIDPEEQIQNRTLGKSGSDVALVEPPSINSAQPEAPNYSIEMFDAHNPRALINILPTYMKEVVNSLAEARPDLLEMDEWSLKKQANPNPTVNRLRISFWNEYMKSQDSQGKMHMPHVYAGVCTNEHFVNYIKDKKALAWILCPPAAYANAVEEALLTGIGELRDILVLPHKDASGKVDAKLIAQKIKIVAMLDMRVKGAIIQKIETKSVSLHGSVKDARNVSGEPQSLDDVNKRLHELEQRAETLKNPNIGAAIEVESEVV